MFCNFIHIDWWRYFECVGTVVIVYWMIIGAIYFRQEIKNILLRNKKTARQHLPMDNRFEGRGEEEAMQTSLFGNEGEEPAGPKGNKSGEDLFPLLYSLAQEIRDRILAAGEMGMVRGELIRALQSVIGQERYAILNDAQYRAAINNLVAVESEQQCGIHFDADELHQLWKTNEP